MIQSLKIPGFDEVHRVPCADSVAFVSLHAVVRGRAFGGVRVIGSDLRGDDVPPESIYDVDCDVFAPCAAGGVLTPETVRRLKCRLVSGAANNPLASDDVAELLGLRYVPDFIANSGATIQGASTSIGEAHLVPQRIPRWAVSSAK